ncbi:MAG: ABC transporter permease [bacterium]|nr:ABC transporter permease [bacterium]
MKGPSAIAQALLRYFAERRYRELPESLGRWAMNWVLKLGRAGFLMGEGVSAMFKPPFRWHLYFKQLEFIGNRSIVVILLTGFAVGAILSLQLTNTLRAFSGEQMVGGLVGLIMAREMGPLMAALMINGRVASAIAAEIGTMRVTEQIDALESMAVDPVQYLIAPRLFAGFFILPVMTMIFNMVGMLSSYLIAVPLLDLDSGIYFAKISDFVTLKEIFKGLAKSSLFGFILAFIGCYKGYYTSGGAEGVGVATTQAVVVGSVVILVADYFVGAFLL